MKIVTVSYLHGSGGAERQITLLSNALAAKGHEVHMIILNENNAFYEISKDVILHDLSKKENGRLRIVKRWIAFAKELRRIRPDISIHFNLQSVYFTTPLKKKYTGKVLYSERGDPADKEYDGLLGIVRNIAFKNTDAFVFQSEGARDFFDDKIAKRSAIIHNSVSIPQNFASVEHSREKRIVAVGRFSPEKNHRMLIDAFAKIKSRYPDYRLEIYGVGPLGDELRKHILDCKVENSAFLIPSVPNIFERIHNASLFVLTSNFEGMPNALMEALALGLPCVATNCPPGGVRSLISDGENGLLVPVNDVDALSKAMIRILEDESLSQVLSSKATEIKETHSPNRIYQNWDEFINNVVKK